jgi:cardiolipin synthase A/B
MKNNTNVWFKEDTRVVDQREALLPPTWGCTGNAPFQYAERGQRVHQSGRERVIANRLVQLLDNAREKVVVSSFLLADKEIEDAILAAVQRGVRVYILLAIETRLGRRIVRRNSISMCWSSTRPCCRVWRAGCCFVLHDIFTQKCW